MPDTDSLTQLRADYAEAQRDYVSADEARRKAADVLSHLAKSAKALSERREGVLKAIVGLTGAACLLLVTVAGADTLTVPITIPPPAPITVPVQTTATLNGVTYQITGTLTLTPVTTNAHADNGPVIGARTAAGLTGSDFGSLPGRVLIGGFEVPVIEWSPDRLLLPLLGGETVTVVRADGLWHTSGDCR